MIVSSLIQPAGAPDRGGSRAASFSAGTFIMLLFMASLAVGFASVFMLYVLIRTDALVWPPPGSPPTPLLLWISTALLLCGSGLIHAAWRMARAGRERALKLTLLMVVGLCVGFLISQYGAYRALLNHQPLTNENKFVVLMALFLALHALHVLGGLFALGFITVRAFRGDYSRYFHPGVWYCTLYWHFLDGMWLIIFAVLVLRP